MSVLFEAAGRVALLTLNRPEKLNALDLETIDELRDGLVRVRNDDSLWVAILTGAGDRAFSAGADLRKLPAQLAERGPDASLDVARLVRQVQLRKPLIAAVNGLAYGGGLELALQCDLRVLATGARLALPEPRVGLMPGWGGTQRLPRAVPLGVAYELLFTGRDVGAEEALRLGLANRVAADAVAGARELAAEICAVSPTAVRAIKEAVELGLDEPLDDGLRRESALFAQLMGSEDFAEGLSAFLEKRAATWTGR